MSKAQMTTNLANGNAARRQSRRIPRGEGREALCRALVRIVAVNGVDAVTYRSVAAEAGVTHGLVSYHFRSREEMIHEALTWATRNAIRDAGIAQAEDLSQFADDLPAMIASRPDEAIFQYQLALEALRRPGLLQDVRKSYDGYITAVRESLSRFGLRDDVALASLVFAMLDGINLQHLIYHDEVRTRRAVAVMRELLRAAGPPQRRRRTQLASK